MTASTTAFHGGKNQDDGIHSPFFRVYADAAARAADTTVTAADVSSKCVAYQVDTGGLWLVTATTPTWLELGITAANLAAIIHAATAKATPVDADELPLSDSAASWGLKKLTWANVKATLLAYFNSIYQPLHAILTSLAGLAGGTSKIPYFTTTTNMGMLDLDIDGTLAANSDTRVSTQKAVRTFVEALVTGLLDLKGSTDCSANPNYPAASKGDLYFVTVAGKIGGASGKSVDIGDAYIASADNAGGTEASVGTSWFVLEHNLGVDNVTIEISGGNLRVKDAGISNAKLSSGAALSVVGRAATSAGAKDDIYVSDNTKSAFLCFVYPYGLIWLQPTAGYQVLQIGSDGVTIDLDVMRFITQNLSLMGVISPTQITANQNNYAPTGLASASRLRLDANAAYNITGIDKSVFEEPSGAVFVLSNISAYNLTLKNGDGSSSANNRFSLAADFVLVAGGSCVLMYDNTTLKWRLVASGQTDTQPQTLTNKTLTRPTITNAAETHLPLTDAATIAWNADSGGHADVTLGGNRTLGAMTNPRQGATYILNVTQDGTGGRTLAFNAIYKFPDGIAYSIGTTAGARTKLTFECYDGTNLDCVGAKNFS